MWTDPQHGSLGIIMMLKTRQNILKALLENLSRATHFYLQRT